MQKSKKQQYFSSDVKYVDYKNIDLLREFIDPHARILPKKKTHVSSKNQRLVTTAIKRARYMALLPYVEA